MSNIFYANIRRVRSAYGREGHKDQVEVAGILSTDKEHIEQQADAWNKLWPDKKVETVRLLIRPIERNVQGPF